MITLLNAKGLKVDGVSYTEKQAKKEGWTTVSWGSVAALYLAVAEKC